MSQEHQRHIQKYFPNRPILYIAGLANALGSVSAGLLLGQLIYWHGQGWRKDGWIYKTMVEMKEETGLTRTQQETAIKICLKYDLIECKRAGIPAKRHFRVNFATLEKQLPSMKEKAGIVYLNPPSKFAGNPQTITKTTQKTTTKNVNKQFSSSISSSKDILAEHRFAKLKSNDFDKKGKENG